MKKTWIKLKHGLLEPKHREQVDSDNVDEWIAKAETLSRADIIRKLKDNDVNYQEPPIVKLLNMAQVSYITDDTTNLIILTNVKIVQQGIYVTVTGSYPKMPRLQAADADGQAG